MHERGAIGRAVEAFLGDVHRSVASVRVRISPDVEETIARDVWAHMTEATPAAGSDLKIEVGRSGMRCFECGTDYEGSKLDPCPACAGGGLVIRPVPAFEIVSWETA